MSRWNARALHAALACASIAAFTAHAHAQSYPAKPVRIIVPWTAGGTADLLARVLAQKMTESFGQQVIADNRPGAGGLIGTEIAAKAAPDGHTLLMGTTAPNSVAPSLYSKIPFDPARDFAYLSLVARTCYVLSVHPSMPVKTVRDLIALAKARPGSLDYGSAGHGTSNHMAMALFESLAGIKLVHVPYKGTGQALADLVAGQIPVLFGNILSCLPYVRAGRLRALGVSSAKRSVAVPDVPTIAEAGVPGYVTTTWHGWLAPAGTPSPVVQRLSGEIARVVKSPDFIEKISTDGGEPVGSTPEQFTKHIAIEIARWRKVVKMTGMRVE